MSALGQKQTFKPLRPMFALPPKADIGSRGMSAKCQKQTFCAAAKERLFDHLEARASNVGGIVTPSTLAVVT
jgi:hypothetical protein